MSPPERLLWSLLRAHRLDGWKFTRQVPEGPYVIDFAARRARLAIELDGESHVGSQARDERRTEYLTRAGWRVIRVTNHELATNRDGVQQRIIAEVQDAAPSPQPSPRGGEGA